MDGCRDPALGSRNGLTGWHLRGSHDPCDVAARLVGRTGDVGRVRPYRSGHGEAPRGVRFIVRPRPHSSSSRTGSTSSHPLASVQPQRAACTRSARIRPMTGANLKPCPENPAPTATGPTRSRKNAESGVDVYVQVISRMVEGSTPGSHSSAYRRINAD